MEKVTINILNYNTYEKSVRCIKSCLKQEKIKFDIIVIDNKSTDNSLSLLKKEFGDKVFFIENDENYGFAKANNLGVDFCRKQGVEYCLLLNSDIELIGKTLLYELVNGLRNTSNSAAIAPLVYNVTSNGLELNQNDSQYLKLLRKVGVLPTNRLIKNNIVTVSEIHGSAILVKCTSFIKTGGFPEHYFMYSEESTFAKKILWENQLLLWYRKKEIHVLHYHDKSSKIDRWRLYLMGRNRTLEFLENKEKFSIKGSIVFYLVLLINRFKMKDATIYFSGVRDGFRLFKSKASDEEIYYEGKMAREKYGC